MVAEGVAHGSFTVCHSKSTLQGFFALLSRIIPMQQLRLICAFFVLAVSVLFTGCTSIDDVMKSYLGAHRNDVIANWGAPQSVMSDGSGGEIWVYSQNRQMTTPGYSQTNSYGTANTYGNAYANPYGATYQGNTNYNGSSYSTYTPAQTTSWTASRTFFINSSGTVYRYAWKGY